MAESHKINSSTVPIRKNIGTDIMYKNSQVEGKFKKL